MDFKNLIETFNGGDIAFIKSLLDSENIHYFAQGENFNLLRPMVEPVRFMVREDQFEKARELIEDIDINFAAMSLGKADEDEEKDKEEEWECTECGAVVAENATVCPQCGADVSEIEDD